MIKYLKVSEFQHNSEEFKLTVNDFTISPNEMIVIRGENGSGKSFFIRQLFQPLTELKDKIQFDTPFEEVCDALKNGYVYIQQHIPLIDGITYKQIWSQMNLNIDNFPTNIVNLTDREIGSCSGGENKLMEFIPWIYNKFKILFMDEVESGLDQKNKEFMFNSIQKIFAENNGSSIVLISHESKINLKNYLPDINIKYYIIKDNLMHYE
jgi:ABC-type multidrug transport system ATPase subunit